MLGLLFFIVTQGWWISRVFLRVGNIPANIGPHAQFQLPALAVIEGFVLMGFALFGTFQMLGMFYTTGSFKTADVDVLFPTPVSPKAVLVTRLLREFGITLVLPLVILVLGWQGASVGWERFVSGLPNADSARHLGQAASAAFMLQSLAWVLLSFGISLALSGPTPAKKAARSIGTTAVSLLVAWAVANVYFLLVKEEFPGVAASIAQAPALAIAFPLSKLATLAVLAPLSGSMTGLVQGLGGLVAVAAIGLLTAFSNTRWMYENAALKAAVTEDIKSLKKGGDMYARIIRNAQKGKIKAGRPGWIGRLVMAGPMAIVWKDLLYSRRLIGVSLLFGLVMPVAFAVFSGLLPESKSGRAYHGPLFLWMLAMSLIGPSMGEAQSRFIESLKRIDLLKPLPFTADAIVRTEVVSKSVASMVGAPVACLVFIVLKPAAWEWAVAGLVTLPLLVVSLTAASMLLSLLLPDIDDPTQKGFRGLATVLSLGVCLAVPAGILVLLMFLKVPIVVACFPAAASSLAMAYASTVFAGKTYAKFNPAE